MTGSEPPGELRVRTALPADDAALAHLFNQAHLVLAGTAVRSAADIAWRCRRQPRMPSDGGVLVETPQGWLVGYAFVKENGDVIEFAIDPEAPRHRVAVLLIEACEERAWATGADQIRLHVPVSDDEVAFALAGSDWAATQPTSKHYVATVDPARLITPLAAQAGIAGFEIILTDPFPWQEGRWAVNDGSGRLGRACRFDVASPSSTSSSWEGRLHGAPCSPAGSGSRRCQ